MQQLLPTDCKPIITDAGFYSPFFKAVEKLGWDWVGRIRGFTKYLQLASKTWVGCKELYHIASKTPWFFNEIILSKSTSIQCSLFIFKGKKKNRIAKNKLGKRRSSEDSKVNAKGNKEPWVLASSLTGRRMAKKVIWYYKLRMQIEEGFRDMKGSRLGFGLEESQTYKPKRFEVLLLIAMLGILAVCIIGKAGEMRGMPFDFQANTIRNRAVLSLFFLGCQIIRQSRIKFQKRDLCCALTGLKNIISPGCDSQG